MKINTEKARNLFKELYLRHALEGDEGYWSSFYEEDQIIKLLKENGYTQKEAEKLLKEHENEVITPYFKPEGYPYFIPRNHYYPKHPITYQIADECDLADYHIHTTSPQIHKAMNENLKKYILEAPHDPTDKTEKLLRTIYAEREKHFLARHTLLIELIRRGLTPQEAGETVQKYEKRYVLLRYESYVKTKQYRQTKPEANPPPIRQAFQQAATQNLDEDGWLDEDTLTYLLTLQNIPEPQARKIIQTTGLEAKNAFKERDGYEITRIEDLLITWAHEIKEAQREQPPEETGNPNATPNVKYRDIREIFKEAYKAGKKTLTRPQIIQKIQEKCKVTPQEAEEAFHTALKNFKIRPELQKNKNKKWEEKEYWWGGTSDYHPPRPLDTLEEEDEEELIEKLSKEYITQKILEEIRKNTTKPKNKPKQTKKPTQ